jgi:hypothetical protein
MNRANETDCVHLQRILLCMPHYGNQYDAKEPLSILFESRAGVHLIDSSVARVNHRLNCQ